MDEVGKLSMNFSPLNRVAASAALNVAIASDKHEVLAAG